MNQKQRDLVAAWNRAHDLQVFYVDGVSNAFAGHEPDPSAAVLGGRNPYRWLNEFFETEGRQEGDQTTRSRPSLTLDEWYHPNITGHEAIARQVEARFGTPTPRTVIGWGTPSIDLAFVVDTGGGLWSMAWAEEAQQMAQKIVGRSGSARFGLVQYKGAFGTPGTSGYVEPSARVVQDFTPSADQFGAAAQSLSWSDLRGTGGADQGISEALAMDWRPGVRKGIVLISKGNPNPEDRLMVTQASRIVWKSLAVDPVEIYGIDLGDLGSSWMREVADGTNGLIIDASDGDVVAAVDQAVAAALDNPWAWIQGPYVVKAGESLTLDAGGSYSPYEGIVSYEWDFDGDGAWDQATTDWWVDHRFDEPSDLVVGLRVTDGRGHRAIGSTRVLVSDDGDSTPREIDNCPDVYNWGQDDSDGDGSGNECDDTPGILGWLTGEDDPDPEPVDPDTGDPSASPEPEPSPSASPTINPTGEPQPSAGTGPSADADEPPGPSTDPSGVSALDPNDIASPGTEEPSPAAAIETPTAASAPTAPGSSGRSELPVTGIGSPGWLRVAAMVAILAGSVLIGWRRRGSDRRG
ncbi:MAG: hypothetical protein LBK95_05985 [Bifidobacteriaceae bacterium]|jgi:hypothetical protein|nr:hypothetical protein [Bifidobacteriaceae bacterium]